MRIKARPSGRQRVDEAAVARIATSPKMRRDMRRRAEHVAAYQRLHIPMKTGKLRSSVRIEEGGTSRTTSTVRVLVGRGVPYAGHWIYGTSPHEIAPRRKKALRFVQNGQVQFRKRVFHPGTKPNVQMLRDSTKYFRG